ncbi:MULTISPECIES: hypothetical protein [unclassified Niallia]|jgi:hypothetical protein|uniref:hypothetical protein n=1 Tax=unclassified Niallia TaxID=2837522 RepID=UPI0013D8168F
MLGETFTLLRPIYYLIAIILICNFVYLVFLRNKITPYTYILFNSLFFLIIGGVLLFQQGIIVDEFNKSGDSLIFYLTIFFAFIVLFSFLFYKREPKNRE